MVIKNIRRYLRNLFRFGSECIYHSENSMIDQVTNNAMGMNTREK